MQEGAASGGPFFRPAGKEGEKGGLVTVRQICE